jgi:hypothetical protein
MDPICQKDEVYTCRSGLRDWQIATRFAPRLAAEAPLIHPQIFVARLDESWDCYLVKQGTNLIGVYSNRMLDVPQCGAFPTNRQ